MVKECNPSLFNAFLRTRERKIPYGPIRTLSRFPRQVSVCRDSAIVPERFAAQMQAYIEEIWVLVLVTDPGSEVWLIILRELKVS